MIEGAVRLLATKGLEGTSFADVLTLAHAPRGSVYHHFPGGKPELLHSALDLATERALTFMEDSRGEPAGKVVDRYLALWRTLLDRSRLTAGCAVMAVTVAAESDALLDHAGAIFRQWTAQLSDLLIAGGVDEHRAPPLATLLVAAVEGAVAICRAERDRQPFDEVASYMVELFAM